MDVEMDNRGKMLISVCPYGVPVDGPDREAGARYIGELILDRWHGTDVAAQLPAGHGGFPDDGFDYHQDIEFGETAVFIMDDEKVEYPWDATDFGLNMGLRSLEQEVMRRWRKAQGGGAHKNG